MKYSLAAAVALLLITACASGPEFDSGLYIQRTTPVDAAEDIDTQRGIKVMWGGLLVSMSSLDQSTQLEILAYPLNSKQRPDTSKTVQGRFILTFEGFLEPVDYVEGRIVTATGELVDTQEAVVGEIRYQLPVVEAEEIYLWPKIYGSSEPRIEFGVGFFVDG